MRGIGRKLVSILAGAAFLIANTPVTGAAVRCPWILSPAKAQAVEAACPCCHGHEGESAQDAPSGQTADSSCPSCPQGPTCPYGCCWCSVAKVPCFFSTLCCSPILLPCLDQDLAEASLFIPAAPCGELIRPPKV